MKTSRKVHSTFSRRFGVTGGFLLLATALSFAGPRPRFELTELGSLPDASGAGIAYGVNDRGDVVGMADRRGAPRPFLFRNGTLIDVGIPDWWGQALVINNRGQMVTKEFTPSILHYFLLSDTGRQDLTLDVEASTARIFTPMMVNDDGIVVGIAQLNPPSAFGYNACAWKNGVATFLAAPANALASGALGINQAGTIVGHVTIPTPFFGHHSFRATIFRGDQPVTLDVPAGAVGHIATSINDVDEIAGDLYRRQDLAGDPHAFLFSEGRFRDLGVLPGDAMSNAMGLNNAGQVVGLSQSLGAEPRAFLYTDGQLYDLNDLVKHARGWYFRTANAINNRGQIVGEALVNRESRPFFLTPIRK
jgi:probable HAF family extracellular repeat protein